jgi:uncharacterized protein (TIGR03435 family)
MGAQGLSSTTAAPRFDVVSIKPNKSTGRSVVMNVLQPDGQSVAVNATLAPPQTAVFQPGGRFVATGTVQRLIAYAYGIPDTRMSSMIVGGPSWTHDDLFDVQGQAALPEWRGGAPTSEMLSMVQSLLADRFKLAIHREARDLPTYQLVLARPDGRLGPQLHHTSPECLSWLAAGRRGAPPQDNPICGRSTPVMGGIKRSAMTMAELASILTIRVQRVVEDRTGLTGQFDVDVQLGPSAGPSGLSLSDVSVFTALEDQLGLKLQARTEPADVLVIDHIEPPTED